MTESTPLFTKATSGSGDDEENIVARMYSKIWNTVTEAWAKPIRLVHLREPFAEFLGTFVLIIFGCGSIAQVVLGDGAFGSFLSINIGWFIGLVLGCYVAIGISGAHLNPAVTFAMALRGNTSWLKVLPYWIAQYAGAFLASAVLYGVYVDAILNFEPKTEGEAAACSNSTKAALCTGKIWATYPMDNLSLANGFLDQVVGTFLLVLGIFAICDSHNSEPKAGMKPLLIGIVLWGVGGSFGLNSGYAVNPARDFSPRLFTAMAGWGKDVFVCSDCSIRHWWWVPLIAPMVGAAIAAFTYWFLIDAHHPRGKNEEARVVNVSGYKGFGH